MSAEDIAAEEKELARLATRVACARGVLDPHQPHAAQYLRYVWEELTEEGVTRQRYVEWRLDMPQQRTGAA